MHKIVQLAEKYVIDYLSPTLDPQVCPPDLGPLVTNLLLQHRETAANTLVKTVRLSKHLPTHLCWIASRLEGTRSLCHLVE